MTHSKNNQAFPETVHGRRYNRLLLAAALFAPTVLLWGAASGRASEPLQGSDNSLPSNLPSGTGVAVNAPPVQRCFIRRYLIKGAHLLPRIEVEEAVYPYLGPGRTPDDVEQARAALEKAYQAKGFQTVSVQIPSQQARRGVVVLEVIENRVGRLRVRGSRYFSLEQIKNGAPSLAEGKMVDFNDVTRDIVALNKSEDRRVTPALRAGVEPNTVDIDLVVKDTLPLHGSLELNNRYSSNTTPYRVNGAFSYGNLWQLGHTIGGSFQVAPERLADAKVYSAFYTAPVPNVNWLSLMLQGRKQDSSVSSLGGIDSAGRGEVYGVRAMMTLPSAQDFFHSFSLGVDYKHFEESLRTVSSTQTTPVSYCPLTLAYSATAMGKGYFTELNASINFSIRGTGSGAPAVSGSITGTPPTAFDANRYKADDNYLYFRGDLAHTQDLPAGFQVYGKVQGQIADQPLLDSEQFGAGGLDTVRGYLESTALGDNAIGGTVELRSPSLSALLRQKAIDEWRVYLFGDAAVLTVRDSLPQQISRFELASFGVGSRIRIEDHFNASIDVGLPKIDQGTTKVGDMLLTFRVWAEF